MHRENPMAAPESAAQATLSFEVSNVTDTRSFDATDVDASLPAEVVAKALSAELNLPQNVCWMLRDDESAAFLDGETAIGQQLRPGSKVTLTPRAHLG